MLRLTDVHVENLKNNKPVVAIKVNSEDPSLTLTCYNKNCFYDFLWSPITKKTRGLCFNNETLKQVNNPLEKIFNIGEVPETELTAVKNNLKTKSYIVMDKSNGHMVSLFKYNGKWILTTKGSFDHEFLVKDREILSGFISFLECSMSPIMNSYTYCFEIIADYDKHTMYEQQSQMYGENVAVLLCVKNFDRDLNYMQMYDIVNSSAKSIKLIKLINIQNKPIEEWFEHKNIEGYVIRFIDNQRVKVKTKEYMFLRYLKDFKSGKAFKALFKEHGMDYDSAIQDIPEEYYTWYLKVCRDYKVYCKSLELICVRHLTRIIMKNDINASDEKIAMKQIAEIIKDHKYKHHMFTYARNGEINDKAAKKEFIEVYDFLSINP